MLELLLTANCFEYMETDVKKFIRSYRSTVTTIPFKIVKSLMYQLCKRFAIDMDMVFCIAGLVTNQPLFAGDSELQQLLHIFRLLGTPNEEVWPGVSKLLNLHEYPPWGPKPLSSALEV